MPVRVVLLPLLTRRTIIHPPIQVAIGPLLITHPCVHIPKRPVNMGGRPWDTKPTAQHLPHLHITQFIMAIQTNKSRYGRIIENQRPNTRYEIITMRPPPQVLHPPHLHLISLHQIPHKLRRDARINIQPRQPPLTLRQKLGNILQILLQLPRVPYKGPPPSIRLVVLSEDTHDHPAFLTLGNTIKGQPFFDRLPIQRDMVLPVVWRRRQGRRERGGRGRGGRGEGEGGGGCGGATAVPTMGGCSCWCWFCFGEEKEG